MDSLSATEESDGLVLDEEDMDEEGFLGSSCSISLLDVQRVVAIYVLGKMWVICL